MSWPLECTINGASVTRDVPEDCTLLTFLRDHLGLTGSKGACLEGECGSCTVLLDGQPVCSCLVLAAQAHGCEVTTIEGLAEGDRLSKAQEAFIDTGAAQCGYCTPGLIVAAHALADQATAANERELCVGVEGNICRCTGYNSIREAVSRVASSE
ncbi:MAG: (2Fe-2S)-binding protein [bacterium]|nr:(2Fe-2S)-binding protein [bacterium]